MALVITRAEVNLCVAHTLRHEGLCNPRGDEPKVVVFAQKLRHPHPDSDEVREVAVAEPGLQGIKVGYFGGAAILMYQLEQRLLRYGPFEVQM